MCAPGIQMASNRNTALLERKPGAGNERHGVESDTDAHGGCGDDGSLRGGDGCRAVAGPGVGYDTDTHRQKYTFLTNRDGTFSIVNQDTGLCVDARLGTKSDRLYLDHCDDSESQGWYLQPTTATISGQQTNRWRLRHASDDKCVNIYREHFGNSAHVGLYDCHGPTQLNDSWVLETAPDADLTHERRMELATHRALWMWDDRPGQGQHGREMEHGRRLHHGRGSGPHLRRDPPAGSHAHERRSLTSRSRGPLTRRPR